MIIIKSIFLFLAVWMGLLAILKIVAIRSNTTGIDITAMEIVLFAIGITGFVMCQFIV